MGIKIRNKCIVVFMALLVLCNNDVAAQQTGNGKKVYVDYHGTRYSRAHDGMLGRWSFYGLSEKSATPQKLMCYNADNILESGRQNIAAVHYPLTGVQSNLDPDFIEFQVLSAKTAKIDGIFIEWGYREHEATWLLNAFQRVAAKYDFEIGVNWCDGWLYYDWITKVRPDITTREQKTQHFIKTLQYLIDSVFTVSTAPKVKGIPVYYMFGGGIRSGEYDSVVSGHPFHLTAGTAFPQALRRVAVGGKIADDKFEIAPLEGELDTWKRFGMSPTPWIPARVRKMDARHPDFDDYATGADALRYIRAFKDKVWDQPSAGITVRSGFVTPGMDNRGCGGWGRGHYFYIPREEGRLYNDMWDQNLSSKDSLDMVFIASWSDYTEGHEIEPTVENGYREVLTTLHKAAAFKEEAYTEEGIYLPMQLFQLRKNNQFLKNAGLNQQVKEEKLNEIAQLISNAKYTAAADLLKKEDEAISRLKNQLVSVQYSLQKEVKINNKKNRTGRVLQPAARHFITIDQSLRDKLTASWYEGYISFEYLDTGKLNKTIITSNTKRTPVRNSNTVSVVGELAANAGNFSIVGEIRTANTGQWKKAKIKLIKPNIDLTNTYDYSSSFKIDGVVPVRNIKLDFTIYKPM